MIRHTIFRSPKTGQLTVEELINGKTVNLTQFGRSMHELGIDMIFAKTATGKKKKFQQKYLIIMSIMLPT